MREWRASDHDRSDEPSGTRGQARADTQPTKENAAVEIAPSAKTPPGAGSTGAKASAAAASGTSGRDAASAPRASASGTSGTNRVEAFVDMAWRSQCARCHGLSGHGDGPDGAFVRAPDLTRPDLQARVTDQDMANVIANGKNRMPKFDLPPEVVAGLVRRIRFLKARD